MSSRVLRKLQNEKDKELPENDNISDLDMDMPIGGARKKQLNINRYDLLNQQSHSESEVKEDDNETEAAKSCEGEHVHESVKKKRKKRKKKSGKHANTHRSSEDNADVDEVERSLREVNRLLGESPKIHVPTNQKSHDSGTNHRKSVLSVQHKHLNANNELKKMFGSKIIQAEHKRKNRGAGGSRGHLKNTWMATSRETVPQMGKAGLSMTLLESKDGLQYFAYEHSQNYRQAENTFLKAVDSLNPDHIVSLINEYPYHVNALIQLSDFCKLSEDLSTAAELIERALYSLEFSFHPMFNVTQGNCRLDYRRQENRALYITIFKHLTFLGGRACCRTALEFCKLLLSLEPDNDPVAIKLAIDFYALRAKEYQWLADFVEELDPVYNLLQLPNMVFSVAVAHFYLGETNKADSYLQNALLMFPRALMLLLDKCSIQIDTRVSTHQFFSNQNEKNTPAALNQLILLYVNRNYHIWKDHDLLPWLEKNVHEVLDMVDRKEPIVEEYKEIRLRRFSGPLPLSIGRHIILSDDIKGVSYSDSTGPIMSWDPLPPKDSINLYTRPQRNVNSHSSTNPFMMFINSLRPQFNPNQLQEVFPPAQEGGLMDEAQALEDNGQALEDNGELRRSVASLVEAMRDLLNNIRPEQQQQNDADDDAGDSPDEEPL
ncbi:unnamed protein product [Ceutorhynchus assimilis]|uniref:Transcription factor 25 n=1 Tax=Ceutorhynchus assimilis TaxID=467358 RepID=A0A9N9QM22_9CUCU|nr:unnamed protein product [Ceutorhynchus assimilis]